MASEVRVEIFHKLGLELEDGRFFYTHNNNEII